MNIYMWTYMVIASACVSYYARNDKKPISRGKIIFDPL